MAGEGEEKKRGKTRITWSMVFGQVQTARYTLITGTSVFVEGVKRLCDSGLAELAYSAVLNLFAKGVPLLPSHIDFIPGSCMVLRASELLDYEHRDSYVLAFTGFSGETGRSEFTCLILNDSLIYARLCTLDEMGRAWERMVGGNGEGGGSGG